MYRLSLVTMMLISGFETARAEDRSTGFFGGEIGRDPLAIALSVGLMMPVEDGWSLRAAGQLLASERFTETVFTGFEFGLRYAPPTLVAPFVGVSVFGGCSSEPAADDGIDNDWDGWVDEFGETRLTGLIAAMIPEAGVQVRFSESSFLALKARQFFTTETSGESFWTAGVEFSFKIH